MHFVSEFRESVDAVVHLELALGGHAVQGDTLRPLADAEQVAPAHEVGHRGLGWAASEEEARHHRAGRKGPFEQWFQARCPHDIT